MSKTIEFDAELLVDARTTLFLTQHGLAEKAGVSSSTVFSAECGNAISLLSAKRICEALGVQLPDIRKKIDSSESSRLSGGNP